MIIKAKEVKKRALKIMRKYPDLGMASAIYTAWYEIFKEKQDEWQPPQRVAQIYRGAGKKGGG